MQAKPEAQQKVLSLFCHPLDAEGVPGDHALYARLAQEAAAAVLSPTSGSAFQVNSSVYVCGCGCGCVCVCTKEGREEKCVR